MISLCGLAVELASPGGGTRVPLWLAGTPCVRIIPGGGLPTHTDGVLSPFLHSVTGLANWHLRALNC